MGQLVGLARFGKTKLDEGRLIGAHGKTGEEIGRRGDGDLGGCSCFCLLFIMEVSSWENSQILYLRRLKEGTRFRSAGDGFDAGVVD